MYDPLSFCLIEKGTSWADAFMEETRGSPPCRINSFAALDDPANHSGDDVDLAVDQLNHWAHVVSKRKKGVPRSEKKKISSPEDLKFIKPLPESFDELMDLAKNHASDNLLQPSE